MQSSQSSNSVDAEESPRKRQKRSNKEQFTSVDRISNLSDSILCHILSFLPTKYAVATSVLSKKWKFLWADVPNLDFEESCWEDHHCPFLSIWDMDHIDKKMSFRQYVNRVLLLHNAKSINKFTLLCGIKCNMYDTDSWINYAILRNVQVLELHFAGPNPVIFFPHAIFTCNSIQVLKLCCGIISVSSMICLPRLRELALLSIQYKDGEFVQKLLSVCKMLESLHIQRRRDDNINVATFKLMSSSLKRLELRFCDEHMTECRHQKLEVDAPALEYFDFHGCVPGEFSIQPLPLLVQANVGLGLKGPPDTNFSASMVTMIQALGEVKSLTLSNGTVQLFSYFGASASFKNLTKLEVQAKCYCLDLLQDLLKSSANLEVLIFEETVSHVTCWRKLEHVPKCLSSRLTTISIAGLEDTEDELAVVGYILKNARVLKSLVLHSCHLDYVQKLILLQKIAKFPRKSEECEIIFD